MAEKAKGSFGSRVRQKSQSLRTSARNYKENLQGSYNRGYSSGWQDYPSIPNGFGMRTAAVKGYGDGLNNHRKSNKYQNKAKKVRKN